MGKSKHRKEKVKSLDELETDLNQNPAVFDVSKSKTNDLDSNFQQQKQQQQTSPLSKKRKQELDISWHSDDATDTVSVDHNAPTASTSDGNKTETFSALKTEADVEKLLSCISEHKNPARITFRAVDFQNIEINGVKGDAVKNDLKKLRKLCLRNLPLSFEIELIRTQYKRVFKTLNDGLMKKNSTCPKKPLSAYFLFLNKYRDKFHRRHPELNHPQLAQLLGEKWKSMDESKRQKYKAQYELEKKKFVEQMEVYNQNNPELAKKTSSKSRGPSKSRRPGLPRTALDLFIAKNRQEYNKQGLSKGAELKAQACVDFSKLPPEERDEFERQAAQTLNDYIKSKQKLNENADANAQEGQSTKLPAVVENPKRKFSESSDEKIEPTEKRPKDLVISNTIPKKEPAKLTSVPEVPIAIKKIAKPKVVLPISKHFMMMATPIVPEKKQSKTTKAPEKHEASSSSDNNSESESEATTDPRKDHATTEKVAAKNNPSISNITLRRSSQKQSAEPAKKPPLPPKMPENSTKNQKAKNVPVKSSKAKPESSSGSESSDFLPKNPGKSNAVPSVDHVTKKVVARPSATSAATNSSKSQKAAANKKVSKEKSPPPSSHSDSENEEEQQQQNLTSSSSKMLRFLSQPQKKRFSVYV